MRPELPEANQSKKMARRSSLIVEGSKMISHYQMEMKDVGANLWSHVTYHLKTVLLFTSDQVLDTVIPGTAFGTLAALSGSTLDLPDQPCSPILGRSFAVFIWLWFVILQFCVQNQRSPGSVAEDTINKPWRPIPSGRMTSEQANKLLSWVNIAAGLLSYYLDVLPIFMVYMCLITAYNDLGGGNKSGIVRNLFCGAGFSCYFGGALSIALGPHNMSTAAWQWTFLVTFGILATTIQTQEFRDEVGDKARGRRTLVIELSRERAFWTVFTTVAFWSVYTPLGFFKGGCMTALLPVLFGGALLVTAAQAYHSGDHMLDRKLYKIWCVWMFGFCPLPLLAAKLA
ncbi:hypothetical protein E8E11_011161 [Didymella keratinophila]|nr:hypothetical protein E8E11_011161 [Didymella keratinophila]